MTTEAGEAVHRDSFGAELTVSTRPARGGALTLTITDGPDSSSIDLDQAAALSLARLLLIWRTAP